MTQRKSTNGSPPSKRESPSSRGETRPAVDALATPCSAVETRAPAKEPTPPFKSQQQEPPGTLIEQAMAKFERLDILVSNAAHQRSKSIDELDDKEMQYTFYTNILAYMRLARAALRHMKPGAAIIATSSETGIKGTKRMPDYSATKGAINAFTKSLAIDLLDRKIRVNAVAPGPVWTPLNPSDAGATAKEAGEFGADSPMKRPAQPEELAPAYVFLASNADSSYITGTVLQVMGGETTGG